MRRIIMKNEDNLLKISENLLKKWKHVTLNREAIVRPTVHYEVYYEVNQSID